MQYNEVDYVVALLRNRSKGVSYADVVENIFKSLGARAAWEHGDQGTLVADPVREQALHDAVVEVRTWLSRGWNVTSFLDEDYPQQLRDIHEMPPLLWSRGELTPSERAIAIVGTRNPSQQSLQYVDELVSGLVPLGFTIVSGLAAGIDTRAHEAALDEHGRTVAIIGTGIDVSYPKTNAQLQERIACRGLVLSQFWPGSAPTKISFPMRNAVMSGYSRASIIVEAGENSGTRIQARLALAHGRPIIITERVVSTTVWGKKLIGIPGVTVVQSAHEGIIAAKQLLEGPPAFVQEALTVLAQ